MFIVSRIVLVTCNWFLALCCSINLKLNLNIYVHREGLVKSYTRGNQKVLQHRTLINKIVKINCRVRIMNY